MKQEDLKGTYKALTIWQPYANLIAIGAKTIETRGWGTRYRGPVLIHAAKRWNEDLVDVCKNAMDVLRNDEFTALPGSEHIGKLPWGETLGKVLCIADLVDSVEMTEGPGGLDQVFGWFGPGRFGWRFENVRPFDPPFALTGKQGLWEVRF